MELKQIKENTWCLDDYQLIPLYMTDENHCIFLDTGLLSQREEIVKILEKNHITPVGILGSHMHLDHSSSNTYFQKKYNIPLVMSVGEASLCLSHLSIKAYFYMFSPEDCRKKEVMEQLGTPDLLIKPEDKEFTFCGITFGIIHAPGHSPDQLCIMTPDKVLYLADSLLTGEEILNAKLPFFMDIAGAFKTMDILESVKADFYIAAHKGVYKEIQSWIYTDKAIVNARLEDMRRLITRPMNISEIQELYCNSKMLLSSKIRNVELYERATRSMVEYLRDSGMVRAFAEKGKLLYAPKQ